MAIRPLPAAFPPRRLAVVRRKDRLPTPLATEMLRLLAERFRERREDEDGSR
jgi:DNA-binding transcriptional LysR family regulator